MEVPREELEELIDRFEKDIEQGISSRNWLRHITKIRAWLASNPTPREADVLPCGHSMGIVFGESSHTCAVCGQPVRRLR